LQGDVSLKPSEPLEPQDWFLWENAVFIIPWDRAKTYREKEVQHGFIIHQSTDFLNHHLLWLIFSTGISWKIFLCISRFTQGISYEVLHKT